MDHAGNRVMPVLGASSGVFGGTEECMVPGKIKNGNILGRRRGTWAGLYGIDGTKGALLLLTHILSPSRASIFHSRVLEEATC